VKTSITWLALAIAIVLIALVIPARAMWTDVSKTWCARQGRNFGGTPQEYWDFIEKCHRRKGTRPCWSQQPEGTTCEMPMGKKWWNNQ
jgi:hypothetical protein